MEINLTASNPYEEAVLNYLKGNASDTLAEKINAGKKTLAQCFAYIKNEAKTSAQNGVAMIEDKVVYGWAVHFFEEDDIKVKESARTENKVVKFEPKKAEKKPEVKKPEKDTIEGQMNLFDFIGG